MAEKYAKIPTVPVFLKNSLLLLLKLLKQITTDFIMFNILKFHIFSRFLKNTKIVVFVMLSLLISACGSGGEGTDPASSSAGSSVNDDTSDVPEQVAAVVISSQPGTLVVNEGDEAIFTVVANGGGELTYQWKKGEGDIPGANNASLTLSNIELSSAGEYSVVITNSMGAVSSFAALLTVNEVLASVQLNWDIPVSREDGSYLALGEIDSYEINYGTDASNLNLTKEVDVNSAKSIVIDDLVPGTYYFAIATIDSDGVHGAFSALLEQVVL